MTFADFAITEIRFRKHFRSVPADSWHDKMIPLADFIHLDNNQREGKYPYIWTVNHKMELSRLLVDQTMVESSEERRDFWIMLKALAGKDKPPIDKEDMEAKIRQQVVSNISAGLMQMAGGQGLSELALGTGSAGGQTQVQPKSAAATGEYMAPWVDTEDCTACDECIELNPNIFAYNDNKKTIIKNPQGGPYRDLVKAAEKCTAQVIHPGLPKDRSEKDIDKWIERAQKYNAM